MVEAFGGEVIGEADNGRAGIEQAEALNPEVILLDVSMPIMGGFAAARELLRLKPQVGIILISQYTDRAYAEEAMLIGVRGYVAKRSAGTELEEAVEAVMADRTFVSPSITRKFSPRPV